MAYVRYSMSTSPSALYMMEKWAKEFRRKEKEVERKRMEEAKKLKEQGIERFTLYDGAVRMDFKANSPRYRYVVTDSVTGVKDESTRGVTTVIGDVLDKPGLRTWPMNMSHAYLFGSTWVTIDEETGAGDWFYNPKKAAIKPETEYTKEQLQGLMTEGQKQWTKRSDRGKDIGSLVHKSCEMFLRQGFDYNLVFEGTPDMSKEDITAVNNGLNSFKEWWRSLPNPKLIDVEKPIYSRQLKYAGTFDLAVEINGKSYLLDIKTTNRGKEAPLGIYPEHFIQLGAYSFAYREETGYQFDDVGVVNVGKDGRLSLATASDMRLTTDECERAFAFAVRLHDWVEKIKPLTKEQGFTSCLYYGSHTKKKVDGANSG